jgi:hypothetical protein
MKEKFEKAKLLGATRGILVDIAVWAEDLYDAGVSERLIGTLPDSASEKDWNGTGSAGPIIERSIVIGHMGRVIDYLNTNVWHGDPSNLWSTLKELMALYGVLESPSAFIGETDNAIKAEAAAAVFYALEEFFARVNFEFEDEALELKELAVIAGLAEKTVRMAAVGQDKNPDLVTFKIGTRTYVTPAEARRWMATKKIDYRPTEYSEDQFLPPVDPKDIEELGPFLRTLREKTNQTTVAVGSRLGWNENTLKAYEALENGGKDLVPTEFSFDVIMQLAQVICPSESAELIRIIDRVLHPILLERKLSDQLPSSTGQ